MKKKTVIILGCLMACGLVGCSKVSSKDLISSIDTEYNPSYNLEYTSNVNLQFDNGVDEFLYDYTNSDVCLQYQMPDKIMVEEKTYTSITNEINKSNKTVWYYDFTENKKYTQNGNFWVYETVDSIPDVNLLHDYLSDVKKVRELENTNVTYYVLEKSDTLENNTFINAVIGNFEIKEMFDNFNGCVSTDTKAYFILDEEKIPTLTYIDVVFDFDTDKMLEIINADDELSNYYAKSNDINNIIVNKNNISITFLFNANNDFELPQATDGVENAVLDKESYEYSYDNTKDIVNEISDGYYLEDGRFFATEPSAYESSCSWEYRIDDNVVAKYDYDSNTKTDLSTNETFNDYYDSTNIRDKANLTGVSNINNKTLREVYSEATGLELKGSTPQQVMIGEGYRDEFWNTVFCKQIVNYFNNMTINDLIKETTKIKGLDDESQYALAFVLTAYNSYLYEEDGKNISTADLIKLKGNMSDEEVNELAVRMWDYIFLYSN